MKKILYTISLLFLTLAISYGQVSPNWQGVLRDKDNKPIANKKVSVRFTVSQGGSPLYQEVHTAQTSTLGLINLQICKGTKLSGDCKNIGGNPGGNPVMLKVELDPNGGSSFKDYGTSAIGGNFFARYAMQAINDQVDDADADPQNEIQSLSVEEGKILKLSKGGGEVVVDADTANELQTLSIQGNLLTISKGNSIRIPRSGSDADADPTNELQMLVRDGDKIKLEPRGGFVTDQYEDADADPTNEFQTLSLDGTELTLSNGNTIDLKSLQKQPDTIWSENNKIVWWQDVTGNKRLQFGTGGLRHFQGGGTHVSTFQSNNVQDYFKWNTLDFMPNSSYYKKGMYMVEHPDWYHGDYWQIDENKLVEMRLIHPQSGSTNGFSISQMFFSSADPDGTQLYDVLISGAGFGSIYLLNPTNPSTAIAGMDVSNGKSRIFAQQKNFVVDDPKDASKQIWYASLEGPEAAMYDRGTSKLSSGTAFVPYKDHFISLAADGTFTISVTPLSKDSKGLAIVKKTKEGFYVQELFEGTGSYTFDWEVKAVRKGYEDFKVIRDKQASTIENIRKENAETLTK